MFNECANRRAIVYHSQIKAPNRQFQMQCNRLRRDWFFFVPLASH